MNFFVAIFLFELIVRVSSALPYTLLLKPVKTVYPPVKVYRYELKHPKILTENSAHYAYHKPVPSQRLYPVVFKSQRDSNFRPRGPSKKEKRKFVLTPPELPVVRDQKLFDLPQQLVPPVSNQIEEYSENKEEETENQENDIRPFLASPHNEKSFSSFGQEKGKIYNKPGEWATPEPSVDFENTTKHEFKPSQLYLQIRHKNTVIHVPQSEALKDAETLEELINAPRLKELARTTHVQETYSEEGYEDGTYDHAGHFRYAQHGEVYDAKDEGKFRIKEPPIIIDYDSDLEESKKTSIKETAENDSIGNVNDKPEPRITRSRSETSKPSAEYSKILPTYKGERKYSSRVKTQTKAKNEKFSFPGSQDFSKVQPTFPSYFGELPPPPESILNGSYISLKENNPSKYLNVNTSSTKIYPVFESPPPVVNNYTNFKPYITQIDSQASPSAKSLKYSRIYSKKTKQLRLEPYKSGNIYEPPPPPPPPPPRVDDPKPLQLPRDLPTENESIGQRIVLPTISYINSLTTAHFGKGGSTSPQEEPKTELTSALNLSQALNYLRNNQQQKFAEPTQPPVESDLRTFEPMKLKKFPSTSRHFLAKTKRDVLLIKERDLHSEDDYEGNDESDKPHNEKNEEIEEDERKRIEEENKEKEKYERKLKAEISEKEREILKETFKNIGVEENISEVFPELPASNAEPLDTDSKFSETPVDPVKYPFYFSKNLPENSALRYASDPRKFPKKSGFNMEFYESRDEYLQCPDFHPDLNDLPNSNSTEDNDTQAGENQRLSGLGDKIACLRMKYFDRDPFDNPIFKEKEIDYVGKPKFKNFKRLQTNIHNQKNIKNEKLSKENTNKNKPKSKKTQTMQLRKASTPLKNFKVFQNFSNVNLQPSKMTSVIEKAEKYQESMVNTSPRSKTIPQKRKSNNTGDHININNRMVLPFNCIDIISKLASFDRNRNLTVDCNDAVLIQEVVNDIAHIKIIPKKSLNNKQEVKNIWLNKSQEKFLPQQTDWIPIIKYNFPKQESLSSRKTDEVTLSNNKTSLNASSDHYVIDELKEDENVRKGEVIEDMNHYLKLLNETEVMYPETDAIGKEIMKIGNSTRRKRQAENESKVKKKESLVKTLGFEKIDFKLIEKLTQNQIVSEKSEDNKATSTQRPFDTKRTLTRLSGIDFLVRYHKNKGKPTARDKTADFWKVPVTNSTFRENLSKPPKTLVHLENPTTNKPIEKSQKKEKLDETSSEKYPEKRTYKSQINKKTDFQKPVVSSPLGGKHDSKLETKETNDFRKFFSINLTPDKITKKPESRQTEDFRKNASIFETVTSPTPTQIITKVSREISESSEKPRTVLKKIELTTSRSVEKSRAKPEKLQYKTISRKQELSKTEDTDEVNQYIESKDRPILYYIVEARNGRGRWIRNYENRKRWPGKYRKERKLNQRSKSEKRRKRPKN